MKATGFIGLRRHRFSAYSRSLWIDGGADAAEVSKRNLHVVTISWGGPLEDPAAASTGSGERADGDEVSRRFRRQSSGGVSTEPTKPGADTPAAFQELCARCNQIGELAGEMGFTAGLHNHMGEMVQTQEEVDRFMAMTDPEALWTFSGHCHLNLAGCDVVGTLERYKDRIKFLDYKDSRWTTPAKDWVQPNGKVLPKDSTAGAILSSIYDLGDGEVDFPACHRVLKSVNYRGWICVDLDTARNGPRADFKRCGDYIVKRLEPIYK